MRYVIDGQTFHTLDGFFAAVDVALAPDIDWPRDLDGFNHVLRHSGRRTWSGQAITLVWRNSDKSRADLGYLETQRVLEDCLSQVHSHAHADTQAHAHAEQVGFLRSDIANARAKIGPTIFDWTVEVIARHGPGGEESTGNLCLELR